MHAKASAQIYPSLAFQQPCIHDLLDASCWLHDFAKYTRYFQEYLLSKKPTVDSRLKRHSAFGAYATFLCLKDTPELALIGYVIVRSHHANLINLDEIILSINEHEERWIFDQQVRNLLDYGELIQKYPPLNQIQLAFINDDTLLKIYSTKFKRKPQVEWYFLTNYFFSLLIESDKLDASDTNRYCPADLNPNAVDEVIGKPILSGSGSDLNLFSQNELRNYVRQNVTRKAYDDDTLETKLFTLSAPTGIGKTLTALDFALKLRSRIKQVTGYRPQIIYALPFINIIEQAVQEYEKVIKDGRILAHYQLADIFSLEDQNTPGEDIERNYHQQQMTWDTWQADIIITTFVQFFETLIGNRNRLLKKFNHFAGSIIVLDEVQTLSIEKLPLIGAMLNYLAKYLDARIIIMTATQPKIFELMNRELTIPQTDRLPVKNMLDDDYRIFQCFRRSKIIPRIEDKIDNQEFLTLFKEVWKQDLNVLIVVNTVRRSIDLYHLIKQALDTEKINVFYLSTNVTPLQRQERIADLKAKLPKKNCILVATQVVEAGVDLDFDAGFRDLGPVDSIVQVAGRINRENDPAREGAPLFVVDFGDCKAIYGHGTYSTSRSVLNGRDIIPEADYRSLVEEYFRKATDERISDFTYSKEIFKAVGLLRYAHRPGGGSKGRTISDFKIIEQEYPCVSVFIESKNDEMSGVARRAFNKFLSGELKREEFERNYKRAFHQRIIAVPRYLAKIDELMKEARITNEILWVRPEQHDKYYDEHTGFIREKTNQDYFVSI